MILDLGRTGRVSSFLLDLGIVLWLMVADAKPAGEAVTVTRLCLLERRIERVLSVRGRRIVVRLERVVDRG